MLSIKKSENAFQRALIFSDIHFGKKNNSLVFNQDCEDFVMWAIDTAIEWGAETCIFLGDWHDNRKMLNVATMEKSIKSMELLDKSFKKVYFLLGNHDLYYRDRRDLHSILFGRKFDNINIVNDILVEGNCGFVSWLIGDEYKQLETMDVKYVFGHFEFPGFLMNSMMTMPDDGTGQLHELFCSGVERVFSGHFHKRQEKRNSKNTVIHYIGNAFPHDFSDAMDFDRGIVLLEWGKEPEFRTWEHQPTYIAVKFSDFINNANIYCKPKASIKLYQDRNDISYEEAVYIKEQFVKKFNLRELIMLPFVDEDQLYDGNGISNNLDMIESHQSIDDMVLSFLSSMNATNSIEPGYLLELYKELSRN